MAITFHPKAGVVLMCDFSGYIAPEMVKMRPVIIISPNHLMRPGLHAVVPMSTTTPDPVRKYHLELKKNPLPNTTGSVWVKCDMVATVCTERLDRLKVGRGHYVVKAITEQELKDIRECLKLALGIH